MSTEQIKQIDRTTIGVQFMDALTSGDTSKLTPGELGQLADWYRKLSTCIMDYGSHQHTALDCVSGRPMLCVSVALFDYTVKEENPTASSVLIRSAEMEAIVAEMDMAEIEKRVVAEYANCTPATGEPFNRLELSLENARGPHPNRPSRNRELAATMDDLYGTNFIKKCHGGDV